MAGPDVADARGGDRDRPGRPVPSARARGQLRPGLGPGRDGRFDPARSRRFTNAEGIEQGTCVHLGECDIGCPVLARNTLDLNYLPRAEHHGAEVRPLHVVRAIEREGDGYRVRSERIEDGRLRARDRNGAHRGRRRGLARFDRPAASLPRRGEDAAGPARHDRPRLEQQRRLPDDRPHRGRRIEPDPRADDHERHRLSRRVGGGPPFIIEDGGFPGIVADWLSQAPTRFAWLRRERIVYRAFQQAVRDHADFAEVMPWFAQGRDAADGRLRLKRAVVVLRPAPAVARLGRRRIARR